MTVVNIATNHHGINLLQPCIKLLQQCFLKKLFLKERTRLWKLRHRAKYFGKLNYILFQPIETQKKNKKMKEKFLNYMNMELISNIKTFRRKTY